MVSVVPFGDLQPQKGSGHERRRMYSRGRVEEGVDRRNQQHRRYQQDGKYMPAKTVAHHADERILYGVENPEAQ